MLSPLFLTAFPFKSTAKRILDPAHHEIIDIKHTYNLKETKVNSQFKPFVILDLVAAFDKVDTFSSPYICFVLSDISDRFSCSSRNIYSRFHLFFFFFLLSSHTLIYHTHVLMRSCPENGPSSSLTTLTFFTYYLVPSH